MPKPSKNPDPNAFSGYLQRLQMESLLQSSQKTSPEEAERVVRNGYARNLSEFAALISPEATPHLEDMAQHSQRITQRQFGKTIRLFAPLYLSNECVNVCKYCGFSRHNSIPRLTISVEQAVEQARKLSRQGYRSLLLVAGEHPKYVHNGYVANVIEHLLPITPDLNIELGPMDTAEYKPIIHAGCEGLIAYQETYHQPTYEDLHTAGPKRFYHWRLDTVERGYAAGFRKLGIGALFGLYDWRYEALHVAAHALYLQKHCWKAQITISLPRMRPASGGYQPHEAYRMSDRQLVQTICAFRMLVPSAGIILSTREPSYLRNGLVPLGITQMSAGSSTEPGGYRHFDETTWQAEEDQPGEQFEIADERSPADIAEMIRQHGYDPVWKDFDEAFVKEPSQPALTSETI